MALKDHKWLGVYRSGDQNLLKDFYAPALESAVRYDRAVGYFSSEVLSMNLQGITSLIRNGGRMRLIIGHPLDEDEFRAVKHGHLLNKLINDLSEKLIEVIELSKKNKVNRLELLAYLIANNKLEIKYALRRKGMYHEKIGIISDAGKDCLVFQGSANETVYALSEGFNAESIMVFPSWSNAFPDYGQPCVDGFEELWNNKQENTYVIDMPSIQYDEIVSSLHNVNIELNDFDLEDNKLFEKFFNESCDDFLPKLPSCINGSEFALKNHQKTAIKKWWANEHKGILELATGSGKTITALSAATTLFEVRKRLILIIAVPYVDLAKQWVAILKEFNILALECWDSKTSWMPNLDSEILSYKMKSSSFFAVVVVNRTLIGEEFKKRINSIDGNEVMFIGDECHNLGSKNISLALPDAYFRLGLSATPFRSDDDEVESPFPDYAKKNILNYFDRIVATYSLQDAILDKVLCEYNYHIVPVHLTVDEQVEYDELSLEISKIMAIKSHSGLTEQQKISLTTAAGKRSMLLGAAENKFYALEKLISGFSIDERKHSLFYCGAGRTSNEEEGVSERVVERISRILAENKWRSSRFTSQESSADRKKRMDNFVTGAIDALVSIRVLDEGVDVPICNKAFILASTKNPRQYIQRRGRVLRRAKGKDMADIYDFVILPAVDSDSKYNKNLIESEMERVQDFCYLATNKLDVEKIIDNLGV